MYRIVDTNVLVVANGREKAPQASPECVLSCAIYLNNLRKSDILVIDCNRLILKEYMDNVSVKGEGIGDQFLMWLLQNQANPKHCERVDIKQVEEYEFEKFPQSESLKDFDKSDRKFVAVALTHDAKPAIAIAIDRGWNRHQKPLHEHGIEIEFLCQYN